jgi:hypothetical protein
MSKPDPIKKEIKEIRQDIVNVKFFYSRDVIVRPRFQIFSFFLISFGESVFS